MAGGKKTSSNSKNTSDSSRNIYCSDKRLIPRIKEYVEQHGNSHLNLDDMVASLQSNYHEYARKKKQPFRSLVSKVYNSLHGQLHNSEEWLEQKEKEHFEKRMKEAMSNELDKASPTWSSSDDDDDEPQFDLCVSPPELAEPEELPQSGHFILSKETCSVSIVNCDHDRNGQSHSTPLYSEPSGDSLATTDSLATDEIKSVSTSVSDVSSPGLAWQCIPRMSGTMATISPCHSSILKKVTFSTPEVTEQRQFEVPRKGEDDFDHRVSKRLKKRHRHHSGDKEGEGAESKSKTKKRRRSSETSGANEGKQEDFIVETSTLHFSDVGGCEKAIQEISKLVCHLNHPEVFTWLGVHPPQGFLLHGPPGCGKTLLAHAIAGELQLPFIKLAATEVVRGVSGESESTLRDIFSLAKSHSPCILFVDEIDAICRKRETAQREMERRIVTQLLACLDDLNQTDSGSKVLVIGATSSPDTLDPALRRAGRFDREISLGIPDQQARESILKVLGRNLRLENDFSFHFISRQTPGFVGADLMALVREAALSAVNRTIEGLDSITHKDPGEVGGVIEESAEVIPDQFQRFSALSAEELNGVFVTPQDFEEALRVVQPSAKREGFATVPDVTWDDVGALESIREELTLAILAPVRYPEQFQRLNLSPPGILLAGPPGCGKTLLAKAIANQTGINFISVKGPELLNMYVGESERAVRQVFQRARNSCPCVIFFDELDALCPKRSDMAESSASSRVVNQLLTEMDGVVARKQVFVMGATNRPDIIDPAVLRPGRLDKVLLVGLPSEKDRLAILNTITKFGSRPKLHQDVNFVLLAGDKYSEGYSGADLAALVREAAMAALRDHMHLNLLSMPNTNEESSATDSGECVVEMKHFMSAMAKLRPSVSKKDRLFYEQMAHQFSPQH